ncbi:MAG TPA: hypothetical protein VGC88_06160 [Terriglobales bacterium]
MLLHSILPVDSAKVESELAQRQRPKLLPCGRPSLYMHSNIVAAWVRSNKQYATKSGFTRTNGGYI